MNSDHEIALAFCREFLGYGPGAVADPVGYCVREILDDGSEQVTKYGQIGIAMSVVMNWCERNHLTLHLGWLDNREHTGRSGHVNIQRGHEIESLARVEFDSVLRLWRACMEAALEAVRELAREADEPTVVSADTPSVTGSACRVPGK